MDPWGYFLATMEKHPSFSFRSILIGQLHRAKQAKYRAIQTSLEHSIRKKINQTQIGKAKDHAEDFAVPGEESKAHLHFERIWFTASIIASNREGTPAPKWVWP